MVYNEVFFRRRNRQRRGDCGRRESRSHNVVMAPAVQWLAFEKRTGFFVYVGPDITGTFPDPLLWETAVTVYIMYPQLPGSQARNRMVDES